MNKTIGSSLFALGIIIYIAPSIGFAQTDSNPPLSPEEREALGLPYSYGNPNVPPELDLTYAHTGNPLIDIANDPQAMQQGAQQTLAALSIAGAGAAVANVAGAAAVGPLEAAEAAGLTKIPVIGPIIDGVITAVNTITEIAEGGGTINAAVKATGDLVIDKAIVDPLKDAATDLIKDEVKEVLDPIVDTATGADKTDDGTKTDDSTKSDDSTQPDDKSADAPDDQSANPDDNSSSPGVNPADSGDNNPPAAAPDDGGDNSPGVGSDNSGDTSAGSADDQGDNGDDSSAAANDDGGGDDWSDWGSWGSE
jgi:hypothetical protein